MSENPLEKIVENTPKKEAYEMSLGGFKLKLNNTMIAMAIPIMSALGGTMWGAFEFYKDYMNMKEKIQKYVAPDLTEIYKKMEVLDANTGKMVEYTQDIKNDLKSDVRRLEGVIESVERSSKASNRDTDGAIKDLKKEVDGTLKDVRRYSDQTLKEINQEAVRNQKETQQEIRALRREVDDKIKKALDNPLSN